MLTSSEKKKESREEKKSREGKREKNREKGKKKENEENMKKKRRKKGKKRMYWPYCTTTTEGSGLPKCFSSEQLQSTLGPA